jgi:hypothetical protein
MQDAQATEMALPCRAIFTSRKHTDAGVQGLDMAQASLPKRVAQLSQISAAHRSIRIVKAT